MRLLCRIFNNSQPSGKNCRKHNIYCCTNRNVIHIDRCAYKLICLCTNHSVNNFNICTKHFKALDMKINRACSEIAATGQGNLRVFKSAEHCADKIVACSEMRCMLIRNAFILDSSGIYFHRIRIYHFNVCTHTIKDFDNKRNIGNFRYIFYSNNIIGKNSSRYNCNCCIFSSADIHITKKLMTAFDNKILQNDYLLFRNIIYKNTIKSINKICFTSGKNYP